METFSRSVKSSIRGAPVLLRTFNDLPRAGSDRRHETVSAAGGLGKTKTVATLEHDTLGGGEIDPMTDTYKDRLYTIPLRMTDP